MRGTVCRQKNSIWLSLTSTFQESLSTIDIGHVVKTANILLVGGRMVEMFVWTWTKHEQQQEQLDVMMSCTELDTSYKSEITGCESRGYQ